MENLSLKDRRRRQSIAFASRSNDHDRYYSRLPTPEESTHSHRSSDDERRNKVTRRHSPDYSQSRNSGYPAGLQDGMLFSQAPGPRGVPDSPPYQLSDAQKPSLPPLKTILASSLTSPPRSPTHHCSSVQPSPQEPAYMSATYKPPSLYPQKKQRTEYLLEPVPPFTSSNSSASPLFNADAIDRRAPLATPEDTVTSPRGGPGDSRQLSLQSRSRYASTTSPRSSQRPLASFFVEPSPSNTRSIGTAPYHQRQDPSMSHSQHQPHSAQQNFAYETSPRDGFERRFERRDSTQASYEHGYADIDRQYDRRMPPATEARLQPTHGDDYDAPQYARRVELHPNERQAEAHYTPYQANQPSFFMPSQYDYRHGRARKRSNLPKQSTEIMKTWFDQNITNPYPSEEQKAVFSNATGISMTQVSNWFINHRRRCPELRDKRERTRGRELEV